MRVLMTVFSAAAMALTNAAASAIEPGSKEFLSRCKQSLGAEAMSAWPAIHVADQGGTTLEVQFDLGPHAFILKLRNVTIYLPVTDLALLCFPEGMKARPVAVLMRNGERRQVETETWVVPSQLSIDGTPVVGRLGVRIPRDVNPDEIASIVLSTTTPTP